MKRLRIPRWPRSVAPPPPGCVGGVLEIAALVSGGEGIIEMIVSGAAGDEEIPGLQAVGRIGGPVETGLVIADWLVQMVVDANALRGGARNGN